MTTVTPSLGRSGWRWLPLVLLVIVADQLSKGWIEANYLLGGSAAVLPWLDIIRLHNPGAAFSFLAGAGGWQRWFFIALALGVSVVLLWWLRSVHEAVSPVRSVMSSIASNTAMWSTSSMPTGAAPTFRPSTSPMPRLAWALRS